MYYVCVCECMHVVNDLCVAPLKILSWCYFNFVNSTFLWQNSSSLFYSLGVNPKVRQSVRTTFDLAHRYCNILREGWKDLLDCLLALFKAQLLPTHMVEVRGGTL